MCENLADSSAGQLEGSLSRPSCRSLGGGPGSEQVSGNWEWTAFGPQCDTDCLCVGRTTKEKCVCESEFPCQEFLLVKVREAGVMVVVVVMQRRGI